MGFKNLLLQGLKYNLIIYERWIFYSLDQAGRIFYTGAFFFNQEQRIESRAPRISTMLNPLTEGTSSEVEMRRDGRFFKSGT